VLPVFPKDFFQRIYSTNATTISQQDNATMAPSDVNESTKDATGVPSGFILKLFQMVNGAPDEVISVSE
jgi:hypothetical protein